MRFSSYLSTRSSVKLSVSQSCQSSKPSRRIAPYPFTGRKSPPCLSAWKPLLLTYEYFFFNLEFFILNAHFRHRIAKSYVSNLIFVDRYRIGKATEALVHPPSRFIPSDVSYWALSDSLS